MAIVYLVENLVNGKTYIGYTARSLKIRRREHLRARFFGRSILGRAIAKHGKDNFKFTEIAVGTEEEMLKFEADLVKHFQPEYNGMGGGRVATFNQRTRQKMSQSAKRRWAQADPEEVRKHRQTASRARWAKPGSRERQAEKMKGNHHRHDHHLRSGGVSS